MLVQVPLIVSESSGVNDMLDRDDSRTPVEFPAGLGLDERIRAQVVQAATKWKRMALKQFGMEVGEGLNTDMRAVRKDYFLDHDHSSYVDQWDWERVITEDQRNLAFLTDVV
jgi:aspartate--ammonia ligase